MMCLARNVRLPACWFPQQLPPLVAIGNGFFTKNFKKPGSMGAFRLDVISLKGKVAKPELRKLLEKRDWLHRVRKIGVIVLPLVVIMIIFKGIRFLRQADKFL